MTTREIPLYNRAGIHVGHIQFVTDGHWAWARILHNLDRPINFLVINDQSFYIKDEWIQLGNFNINSPLQISVQGIAEKQIGWSLKKCINTIK